MGAKFPANDNGANRPSAAATGENTCDGQLLTALLNSRNALSGLLEHAHGAPAAVQSYAAASLVTTDQAIARMGVVHAS